MNKEQKELVDSMHCGLFATPVSIAAAYQQADDFIKTQDDSAYIWVIIYGILNAYHEEFERLNHEL
jgi:hypothetical protein